MKKSKNTISDWLAKHSNPEIDKQVEREIEMINAEEMRKYVDVFKEFNLNENQNNLPTQKMIDWYKKILNVWMIGSMNLIEIRKWIELDSIFLMPLKMNLKV